jgi:dTDP-4-amino-4,6-dideoxygalactose transaminase
MKSLQVLKPIYRVEECLKSIRECLDAGWTGLGGKTVEFEQAWKKYTGLPHAHFVNSATAGLHLAVKIFKDAYGWSDGDEIITTPLTFVSTNHAILYERLFPVFADVDERTLCLDPKEVESKITTRTRAVMYVGMGGNPGPLNEIRAICKKHGLKFILDAAHLAGAEVDGRHIGNEADVAVFSFQSVKNLPTADSGMVCFQDAEFDAKSRKLSWLGIDKDTFMRSERGGSYKWRYDVPEVGYKYHGNAIMAALGLVGLKYLDEDNKRRIDIALQYKHNFPYQTRGIVEDPNVKSSCHLFQMAVYNRDAVVEALNKEKIYPGVHYIDNTFYRMYRHGMNTCPVAHELSNELLTLPIHLELTDDDVVRVIDTLKVILDEQS